MMKNDKGFTLIEILAVIIILVLVMSIAFISIGGILERTRQNSFKATAASIIDGVRKRLLFVDGLVVGDYEFTNSLLESGGEKSPLGGTIKYRTDMSSCSEENTVDESVCKVNSATCSATSTSFVRVAKLGDGFTYSICLTAGANKRYIDLASEDSLLDASDSSMIKGAE